LNIKGNIKKVGNQVFWHKKYINNVPDEMKEMIYQQFFCDDSIYIYCDMSMNNDRNIMSVACSYVSNGKVIVKHQLVYPPQDCLNKNIFGEIKAIIFALTNFEKYMDEKTAEIKKIVILSDINFVEDLLLHEPYFRKNSSLNKIQSDMKLLYRKMQNKYPNKDISIKYLQQNQKSYNPFYKSAHNAAKSLLQH
jgi:hypothetical protein